jgi:hypothetical protein
MSLPSDREQNEILKWQDEQSNMRITDKIKKNLSEAEQRILQQIAPIQQKVDEHDNIFADLGRSFSAGFGIITSVAGKVTGKTKPR